MSQTTLILVQMELARFLLLKQAQRAKLRRSHIWRVLLYISPHTLEAFLSRDPHLPKPITARTASNELTGGQNIIFHSNSPIPTSLSPVSPSNLRGPQAFIMARLFRTLKRRVA